MTFPTYGEYRDSGLEWLGDVPAHWTVMPIRMVARLESGHTPSRSRPDWWQDCTIPWFTLADVGQIREQGQKIIHQTQELVSELGLANSSARLLPRGTVMLSRTASVGFSAIMGVDMATTQDFANWVCGPRLNNEFLLFVFKAMTGEFERLRYGSTHNTIYMPDIAAFRLALPPLHEQQAIVAFLDRETAKIDALVEEQRRLITLLKEKRQAAISEAVTKGIDPDVPMKDSGIDWLGLVPAHWAVVPVGYRYEVQLGRMLNAERALGDDLRPYLRVADVQWGEINTIDLPLMNFPPETREMYRLRHGDLLVNEGGSYVGRSAIWRDTITECYYQKALHRVRARDHDHDTTEFFLFTMEWATNFGIFTANGNQTTIDHLTAEQFRSYKFAFPPIFEQQEIAAYLRTTISKIERLRLEAESVISLLIERRSTVISAAVTGKIDVRKSATVLPFPIDRARARRLVAIEIIERLARQPTFGRTKLQKIVYLAEAHANINEIAGSYVRMPYGPFDQAMIDEIENGVVDAGISVDDFRDREMVRYYLTMERGRYRSELSQWLGDKRTAKLDKLIADLADLNTHAAEAVATLYAVWNDALIDRKSPSDLEIVSFFLNDWNVKKRQNFHADELHTWLSWMRRRGLVPCGAGPKTSIGGLFA